MNKLFLTDIRRIRADMNSFLDDLTIKRRLKAGRYLQEADKLRCIAAGLLIQKVLNVNNDDELTENEYGKPMLENGFKKFNLSHSGDYVCLAVSEKPVGVDIEKIEQPHMDVAENVFHKDELEYLQNHLQKSDDIFYSIWTLKESLMKAVGLGLHLPPESFAILPEKKEPYLFCGKIWYFKQYRVSHDYIVSVCGQENCFDPVPEIVEL